MKTLCLVLGLYNVYRSNTKFKCCWCAVGDCDLHRFDIPEHPFRDIDEMKKKSLLGKQPTYNEGIKVRS
jgi:hypothetical protein